MNLRKKKRIYLDHAASTPCDKYVLLEIKKCHKKYFANPKAIHREGTSARNILAEKRKKIAGILGAQEEEIIFTGSGTESDNLAIKGVVNYYRKLVNNPHVITINIEHPAVLESCRILIEEKIDITFLPVEKNGIINLKLLKESLKENTVLISVMYANNEIGTIQPIQEISKIIRQHREKYNKETPFFHTDAVQATNYLLLKVAKLGVDLMSLNSSKIYGPKGVGILYKKRGVPLNPIIFGGNQEYGFRAGTENIALISGFSKALEMVEKVKEKELERITKLHHYFINKISSDFSTIIINGDQIKTLPNIVNISIPNIESELLIIELDARGIAVSAGAACKTGSESHVIKAIQSADSRIMGNIRFSFGRTTRRSDLNYAFLSLKKILQKYKIL